MNPLMSISAVIPLSSATAHMVQGIAMQRPAPAVYPSLSGLSHTGC